MALTANALYGFDPTAVQPTPDPVPTAAGVPEQTVMRTAKAGRAQSPILAVVVLIGIVVVLSQVSFRGTISVKG